MKIIYKLLVFLYIKIGLLIDDIESTIEINLKDIEFIITTTFNSYNFIKTKSRKRKYVISKQIYVTALRNNTKLSMDKICDLIGYKSHRSIIHALKTVDNLYDTDEKYRNVFDDIFNKLGLKYSKYKPTTIQY